MIWLAIALAVAFVFAVGYLSGRVQPLRRVSDWANWQKYDPAIRPRSARRWAIWTVLSAENLTWLALHPVKGWHAWRHRNDPPPPRSPAPAVRRIPDHTVDEEA